MFQHVRARTHHAHLACENIKKLRQLIDIESAQPPADPGDPFIVGFCRPLIGLIVGHHRAKFQAMEEPAMAANSFLTEKNRTFRVEPDQECHQRC